MFTNEELFALTRMGYSKRVDLPMKELHLALNEGGGSLMQQLSSVKISYECEDDSFYRRLRVTFIDEKCVETVDYPKCKIIGNKVWYSEKAKTDA